MAVSVFLPLRDVSYPELLHKRAIFMFVLNTRGWPWKAFTGTSKCTRIWSRLMSPDVRTTSLQQMFLPAVKHNLITALLTLLSLSVILKTIVYLSPNLNQIWPKTVWIIEACITTNLNFSANHKNDAFTHRSLIVQSESDDVFVFSFKCRCTDVFMLKCKCHFHFY